MRRTDRTKSDRKYLKANILGFPIKIHKIVIILLSIMVFITLTGLALTGIYNMKQSQNITDKATTQKITQQETSTRKKQAVRKSNYQKKQIHKIAHMKQRQTQQC